MHILRRVIVSSLSLSLIVMAPAQSFAAGAKKDKPGEISAQGPRRHLATIVFAGLAGAILGLSTLSFYGRPQDRLSNIAVGFAFGVITGTGYTMYKAATEPKDFYTLNEPKPELWNLAENTDRWRTPVTPKATFVFEF